MMHDRQIEAAERVALRRYLRSVGRPDLIHDGHGPSANDCMMREVCALAGIVALNDIVARAHARVAAQREGVPMPDYIQATAPGCPGARR